jgi:hypothetical protein
LLKENIQIELVSKTILAVPGEIYTLLGWPEIARTPTFTKEP